MYEDPEGDPFGIIGRWILAAFFLMIAALGIALGIAVWEYLN
jgi:hypothetical protein